MTLTTLAASDTAAASSYTTIMDHVAQAFEVLGTLILAVGVLWSFVLAVLAWRRSGSGQRAYKALRQAFGGTLLLALEIRHACRPGLQAWPRPIPVDYSRASMAAASRSRSM